MKFLNLEEARERLQAEFERVSDEAKVKYGTTHIEKLKDTSGHDRQQAEDRKALVFQMEAYLAAIIHLQDYAKVRDTVYRVDKGFQGMGAKKPITKEVPKKVPKS